VNDEANEVPTVEDFLEMLDVARDGAEHADSTASLWGAVSRLITELDVMRSRLERALEREA
jgi:hypothetical protein